MHFTRLGYTTTLAQPKEIVISIDSGIETHLVRPVFSAGKRQSFQHKHRRRHAGFVPQQRAATPVGFGAIGCPTTKDPLP